MKLLSKKKKSELEDPPAHQRQESLALTHPSSLELEGPRRASTIRQVGGNRQQPLEGRTRPSAARVTHRQQQPRRYLRYHATGGDARDPQQGGLHFQWRAQFGA